MCPSTAVVTLALRPAGLALPAPALIKALVTGPQLRGTQQLRALVASSGGPHALTRLLQAMGTAGLAPPPGWTEAAQLALASCVGRCAGGGGTVKHSKAIQ